MTRRARLRDFSTADGAHGAGGAGGVSRRELLGAGAAAAALAALGSACQNDGGSKRVSRPPQSTLPLTGDHRAEWITASDHQLVLHDRPWVMSAASVYNGFADPAAVVQLAGLVGINTFRIIGWMPEQGDPEVMPYSETIWVGVDEMVSAARNASLRVILDLSTYRNVLVNAGIDPYTSDWTRFLEFVAGRQNSVTGTLYRDDPTIALVSFAGEVPDLRGDENQFGTTPSEVVGFFDRTLETWRSLAPKHLRSPGGLIHCHERATGIDWRAIFTLPAVDVPAIHTYSYADFGISLPAVAKFCRDLKKPWINEEFGFQQEVGDEKRATDMSEVYEISRRWRAAGIGFWNLGTEVRGGSFDVNEAGPTTLAAVRDASQRFMRETLRHSSD